jgi:hypothetical protein
VAVCEFKMQKGSGFADYLLFVDGKAVGALEAKPVGFTLSGVMPQAQKYAQGLPESLDAPVRPLPFLYVSTGVETCFAETLDPDVRSRRVFNIHRPESLAERITADPLDKWVRSWGGQLPGETGEQSAVLASGAPAGHAAGRDPESMGKQSGGDPESGSIGRMKRENMSQ